MSRFPIPPRGLSARAFPSAALLICAGLFAAPSALAQPVPLNDTCAGAEVIPATGPFPYLTAVTDITNATSTDPTPSCQPTVSRGVWYSFTPAVSGRYYFSTCTQNGGGTTVSDTVIAVYTSATACTAPYTELPGGSGIGCDDDGCYATGTQSITASPLTAGVTYYIVVYKFGTSAPSAGQGLVQLRVGLGNGNDACASALPLSLSTPTAGSSQMLVNDFQLPSGAACFSGVGQSTSTATGRDSVWSFTAPSTGKYSFRIDRWGHDSPNPVLYLSSSCPTGTAPNTVNSCVAAANRSSSAVVAGEEVYCQQMNAGDTYYVIVDETSQSSFGTPYNIEVSRCVQESEPNDAPNSANVLACGVEGGISTSTDVDFFDLGSPATGSRVFAMIDAISANSTNFDLRVTSATGTLEYDDADDDTQFGSSAPNIAGTPMPGGQAYLGVNASTATEPYRLYSVVQPPLSVAAIEDETTSPNNTLLSATVGTYVYGTFSGTNPSLDPDFYAFGATAGDIAYIGLDGDPTRPGAGGITGTSSPVNAGMQVFDVNGNLMFTVNDSNSSTNTTVPGTPSLSATTPNSPGEGIVFRVPVTGTYFVKVFTNSTTAPSAGPADYLFSVSLNCQQSVAMVSPSSGPTGAVTTVTVKGVNFQPGATVTVDGVQVTPVSYTSTQFTIDMQPHAKGVVQIVVNNPDGSRPTGSFTYLAPPSITGVTPSSGKTAGGEVVTIQGADFRTGATVTFNGSAATLLSMTPTSITVRTPSSTPGSATIVVTNVDGQSGTNSSLFTYYAPPAVTAPLDPDTGYTLGGATVVIHGQYFRNGVSVNFGGVPATSVTFDSSTQLTVITPGHAPGAVDVVVTNPDGQSTTVTGGFTYVTLGPPPTITSLTPNIGTTAGGTTVTVEGTNFYPGSTVTFGGTNASVTYIDPMHLSVVTPPHAFGNVDVVVHNPDFQFSAPATYTYDHPAPTLTQISPPSGTTLGATNVTLTGSNFLPGATFTIGGTVATNINVVNATTITGKTPAHGPGIFDVVVTNADGKTVTLPGAFEFIPPPTITSISPTSGTSLGGQPFAISGADFRAGATVLFGTVPANNVTVASANAITGTTPPHAAGVSAVKVINPDNQSATLNNAYTFIAPPIAAAISPNVGATAGGTNATIFGSGFTSASVVTVGGNPATVTSVVSNQIRITTPPGAEGPADVVVTNADGQFSTIAGGFTYVAPPVLTNVTPNSGTSLGGTQVTLTGDKFNNGATVFFGTRQVPATFVSATQLTAITPPQAAGVVDVTVKNPDGQSATLTGAFTYVAPPSLASLTPNRGPEMGGTKVTIKGAAFMQGATVTFGGTAATNVTVTDANTLTAHAPAHAAGFVDVQVTNPDGQSASLSQAFQYVPAPTLSAMDPTTGPATGGTRVTLTGTNFAAGVKVTFGGVDAASVVFEGATQLSAVAPPHATGAVDVTVTNADGQSATLPMAFTYTAVGPTLTVITPSVGPGEGGTPVLLGGTGFQPGATVTFGGVAATEVQVVNSGSITLRTPPHAQGQVDVVVTNPDNTSVTVTNGFRYLAVSDAGTDAGVVDAGTPEQQPDAGQVDFAGGSSGCGCTETNASVAGFALLGLGTLLSRRRRVR